MADRGIFVNYKEETRGTNRYQVYSCSCNPELYGPYEQIILHLRTEHRYALQFAEITVHYAKKPIIEPENWMR